MKKSNLGSSWVVLVGAFACSGNITLIGAEQGTRGATVAGPESSGRVSSCDRGALPAEANASPAGAEVWRRTFSQDDVLKLTSVASDPTTDAVFVARAAGETFKFDRSGSVVWEKPFGSLVAADGRGNAYVAGTFSGAVSMGPYALTSAGGTDVYVALLDADGGISFGLALGGAADESAVGIAVDALGNAVVSGPGLGTVKLDTMGRSLWRKEFFGHVAVDSTGNVLLTGALTGTMSFGAVVLESRGGKDVFVAKLDAAGTTIFARGFGDAGVAQYGEAVAVDRGDDILVSGVIDGSVDFGGGALGVPPGTCPSETWCKQAGFVVELDSSGHHLWSRASAPVRSLPGIVSDSQGNVLVSGASPGNAPPYRIPLLMRFDAAGNELRLPPHVDAGLFATGAGHGVAFDGCDDVVWALGISPSPGANEQSVLVKLAL